MSIIDLHMHSTWSDDGEFSVMQLVDKCLDKKLICFSITDHNSVQAYSQAIDYVKGKNIRLIPGIELDCRFQGVNLHVLGYGIDYHFPEYEKIRKSVHSQEVEASKIRLKVVRELGIFVDEDTVQRLSYHGVINGEMIAEAALMDSRNDDLEILKPYRSGGARSDNPFVNFYWDICSQGKPAYAPIDFISLDEAIDVIHRSGGVAVLAHPGNNTKENKTLLDGIIKSGIDGIEVYSSYHKSEQIDFYRQLAKEYNLLITCGSDFHGKTKPAISIGQLQVKEDEKELIENLLGKIDFYQQQK